MSNKKIGAYAYRGALLATILGIGVISYNMVDSYKQESVWKKKDSAPLASLEPYMLYLEDGDFDKLRAFDDAVAEVYNEKTHEFEGSATDEKIKNLQSTHDSFSEGLKNRTKEKLERVKKLWDIKTGYESIINADGSVKIQATPKEIQKYIEANWSNLINHLDATNSKGYYKDIYDKIISVANDTEKLKPTVDYFQSKLKITDKGIELPADTDSSYLQDWKYYQGQTVNEWEIITKVMNPYIEEANGILKDHDQAISTFDRVNRAESSKKNFEKWIQEYRDLSKLVIDLPDFVGEDRSDVESWLKENPGVKVQFYYDYSLETRDKVIDQNPSPGVLNKIFNNGTINITLSREEQRPVETTITEQQTYSEYFFTQPQQQYTFAAPVTTQRPVTITPPQTQQTTQTVQTQRVSEESTISND